MASKRTDLVFDVYVSPSILKGKTGETFEAFSIGAKQKSEGNINNLLSNSSFKNELLNFLYMKYEDSFYAALICNKEFFCPINNHCMKYYFVNQELKRYKQPILFGKHLEADTGGMFHAKHANIEGAKI